MTNSEFEQVVDEDQGAEEELSFESMKLDEPIVKALGEMGFEKPTPIQTRTYESVMAGRDVIAMAQTGTGKTAAFGIPLVHKVDPERRDVFALILTPTRELALQVTREVSQIGRHRGVRTAAIYGGASFTNQVKEIQSGVQIIAGTPGRVLDHIRRGTIRFEKLGVVVLDEADEMLSMGFEKEISEIIDGLPKKKQMLLFSATIPDDIRRLSSRYMGQADVISVSGDEVAAKDVTHYMYLVSGTNRPVDLVRVIEAERPESSLVFCNTRDETQTVARYLKKAGYNAAWINSDLSQNDREKVMSSIREGKIDFLVATDVAARGIDVSHLSHVINYAFPESLEGYIHRTGRTGRAGRAGVAVSLVTPQDIGNLYYLRLTYKLDLVERTLPKEETIRRKIELERIDQLRDRFGDASVGEFYGLAARVMHDAYAMKIVAGLLEEFFEGAEIEEQSLEAIDVIGIPKEVDEELEGEEIVTPVHLEAEPIAEEEVEPERSEVPIEAAHEPEEAELETAPVDGGDEAQAGREDEGEENEIYVDAGRKDGLRISHLMKEIVRLTGLPRTSLGRVRMLTRSTFIQVSDEHFDKVLDAVAKIEFHGRALKAEPAQQP